MVRTRSMTAVLRSRNLIETTKAAPPKQRKAAQLKRKAAAISSSEDLKTLAANAVDVDKILRLKKEALEAMQSNKHLPLTAAKARLTAAGETETQPSGAEEEKVPKKKTKVVKYLVSQAYIDHMKARPFRGVDEIPEDKLAKESQLLRDDYRAKLHLSQKLRACQQVLLDQYDAFGYAYDAEEVTDDEGDDDGVN